MYCNNCGKKNPEQSKFCKYCGSEIIRISEDESLDSYSHDEIEEASNQKKSSGKVKAGLHGWLFLVGLGLIVSVLFQGYSVFEYFELFKYEYEIPGYAGILQFEFFASIIFTVVSFSLLVLYFKKHKNFPKYFIYTQIAFIVFGVLDLLLVASLTAPTSDMQQAVNDVLSDESSSIIRAIIVSIIWITYIKKSKQVKATFINS